MLSITACAKLPRPAQIKPVTPDPAHYSACLSAKITLPTGLPALAPFTVPAGTIVAYGDGSARPLEYAAKVVLLSTVNKRDGITSEAYLSERSGRQICQSAAQYTVDWIAEVNDAAGAPNDGR